MYQSTKIPQNVTNVRKCKEVKYYIKQLAGYKVVHVLSVTGAIYTPFRMYGTEIVYFHVWITYGLSTRYAVWTFLDTYHILVCCSICILTDVFAMIACN